MDTEVLEYLIMIAHHESISKAAEAVHISQSAMSQCLSKVEKELGCQLFLRANRKMISTNLGKIYLQGAREMVAVKEDVYKKIRNMAEQDGQSIRIAVDPLCFEKLTQQTLPQMQEHFPDVKWDLYLADSILARQYLVNNIVDAAVICTLRTGNTLLDFHFVVEEEVVLAAPVSYLEKVASDVELSQVSKLPFIFPQSGTYFRPVFNTIFTNARAKPNVAYEAENLIGVKLMMEQGYGLALLPRLMTKPGESYRTFSLAPPYHYKLHLATPKYAELQEPLQWLLEWLRQEFV